MCSYSDMISVVKSSSKPRTRGVFSYVCVCVCAKWGGCWPRERATRVPPICEGTLVFCVRVGSCSISAIRKIDTCVLEECPPGVCVCVCVHASMCEGVRVRVREPLFAAEFGDRIVVGGDAAPFVIVVMRV